MTGKKFKFKRNFFGEEVLYVSYRYSLSNIGDFGIKYKKASRDDVIDFTVEIEKAKESIKLLNKLKEKHSNILI